MFATAKEHENMFSILFSVSCCFKQGTGWVRPDREHSDADVYKSALSNAVSLVITPYY